MDCKLRVKKPGIISLYMHMYKYVCMCRYYLFIYDVLILCFIFISCLPGPCGSQKKASDPP